MTVKELENILSITNPDADLYVRIQFIDEFGETQTDLVEFEKFDVIKKRNHVIIDISNNQ